MIGLPISTGLCGTFQEASRWVWNRLELVTRRGLSFSEPTITELLLSELALKHPKEIGVLPFSAREEARTGADWAWCFVDKRRKSFRPMLVQAKRLYKSGRYEHLRHVVKGPPDRRQIDILLAEAKRRKWPAIHVFYNHPTPLKPGLAQRRLGSSWGCAIAPSPYVDAVIKKHDTTAIETLFPIMSPWEVLVCGSGAGRHGGQSLPLRVSDTLNGLLRLDPLNSIIADDTQGDARSEVEKWLNDMKDFLEDGGAYEPTMQAPDFIDAFLEAEPDEASGFRFPSRATAQELREEYPEIRGAVLLYELEEVLERQGAI